MRVSLLCPLLTCLGPLRHLTFSTLTTTSQDTEVPIHQQKIFSLCHFLAAKFGLKDCSILSQMNYLVNLSSPHFPELFSAPRGQSFNSSAVHPSILLPPFFKVLWPKTLKVETLESQSAQGRNCTETPSTHLLE